MTEVGLRRAIIAVVGDASAAEDSPQGVLAFEVGRSLVDAGYRVVTGGLGGVMEAASRGARGSARWQSGDVIGLLPGSDGQAANPYVDIAVCTGLDHGRNLIVGQARALVAIGGGAGTLSEMAFAWIYRRLVIGMRCGGWSEHLADQRIDERVRYRDMPDDRVFGARDARDVIDVLEERLPLYTASHGEIRRRG